MQAPVFAPSTTRTAHPESPQSLDTADTMKSGKDGKTGPAQGPADPDFGLDLGSLLSRLWVLHPGGRGRVPLPPPGAPFPIARSAPARTSWLTPHPARRNPPHGILKL